MNTRLILLLLTLSVACTKDEADVSAIPSIAEPRLTFVDAPENVADTLILTFSYKDGEQDLGLDYGLFEHSAYPYHFSNFYQASLNGLTEIVPASAFIASEFGSKAVNLFESLDPADGKLAVPRTTAQSLSPYSCKDYMLTEFALPLERGDLLDELSHVLDTVPYHDKPHLVVRDTLYMKVNQNHYNISIDFLTEQSDGSFLEYDWFAERCETFDGRFPFLYGDLQTPYSIKFGPFSARVFTSTKGELTYRMSTRGFKFLWGGKRIRLRVSITDRALNKSNLLETEPILI